jgi:hypothetical protein
VKSTHVLILVAVIAVAAVAGFLVKGQDKEPVAEAPRAATQPPPEQPQSLPPGHPQVPQGHPPMPSTPPGHPPVPGGPGGGAGGGEGAGLTWKLPAKWKEAPSTSSMRLATFKVDDAEMSVIRAGGSTKANVDRWIGQFAQGAESKQTERTVKGLKVTIVEVKGTYSGGMMGGEPKANQALLGAVVETPPDAHFFKLTGPEKTVLAARADFEAFVNSLEAKK